MSKPSELEGKVLEAWRGTYVENNVFSFAITARESDVEISKIRRAVRALARKGYLEFCNCSWTDEGEMRGAGYMPTEKGYAFLEASDAKN